MHKRLITVLVSMVMLPFSAIAGEPVLNIVPQPESIEITKGRFKVAGTGVNADPSLSYESLTAIQNLANSISIASGKISSFAKPIGIDASADKGEIKGIVFLSDKELAPEEYRIEITPKYTKVFVSDYNSTLYAIQTIKQMLPVSVYSGKADANDDWHLPCAIIRDKPRFAYRGMHLDCARHFFSVTEVKKCLDIMAVCKLNRFHWHLSDDQGWRIEIKAYPELTLIGGYRSGTMIGRDFGSDDHIRYGGYYTHEQTQEVIEYATALGITVIPEVDIPGHMLAAMSAYPWLGCTGGPYETWRKWGVTDQVLCPGKDTTFDFLEGVLSEIADLFPSEYIHIGGNGCPKAEWENCSDCQALIERLGLKDDEKFTAEQYLQSYVIARVQDFLSTKGKRIIGWDEILEGSPKEGSTVMSQCGIEAGKQAAERGFDTIMAPVHFSLDCCQSEGQSSDPLNIDGSLPLEKVYSFDPTEGLSPEAAGHILGVQANLWTEYVQTNEHLEYMLLPRLLALSEVQWCQPEAKDYLSFKKKLADHGLPVLDALGYNYRKLD